MSRCAYFCDIKFDRDFYNLKIKLLVVFQENNNTEIFHIPYYKKITKYMQLLGQDPRHKSNTKNIIVIIVVINIASIILPTVRELY